MATVQIIAIKKTPSQNVDYVTDDKDAVIVETKDDGKDNLTYAMRDKDGQMIFARTVSDERIYKFKNKKGMVYELSESYLKMMDDYIQKYDDGRVTFETIKSSLNCNEKTANKEFQVIRDAFPKRGRQGGGEEILQFHITQNFGIAVAPLLANKIGVEFAERFLNKYQCVITTHINTGKVHNHIVFNATSYVDGKKFQDKGAKTKTEMRKVSDDLCVKYGLPILEKTREAKYIKYVDANGHTKFYEPTERKNSHEYGEFSNKNDFRNHESYRNQIVASTHIEELTNEIEDILTNELIFSYEDLLSEIRNRNYDVLDKTKTGEWRKHISFKKMDGTWDKYVRDSSLGDGEEYTREVLTILIEKEKEKKKEDIYIPKKYSYGDIDVNKLHREYRYIIVDGKPVKKKRSKLEIYVFDDVKKTNDFLNKETEKALEVVDEKSNLKSANRNFYYIKTINDSLRTLRFIEKENITGFSGIQDNISNLYFIRNKIGNMLNEIRDKINDAGKNVSLINRYNEMTIQDLQGTISEDNKMLLPILKMQLEEKNLLEETKQTAYIKSYNESLGELKRLTDELNKTSVEIAKYDACVNTVKRISGTNGVYAKDVAVYEVHRKNLERVEKQNERITREEFEEREAEKEYENDELELE